MAIRHGDPAWQSDITIQTLRSDIAIQHGNPNIAIQTLRSKHCDPISRSSMAIQHGNPNGSVGVRVINRLDETSKPLL
jgi:hypothetical protein